MTAAGNARDALLDLVDQALGFAEGQAANRVAELRSTHPYDRPQHTVDRLERQFSRTVTLTGAGTGAVAAAPGVGLGLAVGMAGGDVLTFLTAAATHVLAVANVHDADVRDGAGDLDRRRALLLGVLLGNSGAKVVINAAGQAGASWGRLVLGTLPVRVLTEVNRLLGGMLLRRFGPRAGLVAAVKVVPLGLGAVLGGSGNYLLARDVVESTRTAFGTPPAEYT